MTMIQAVDVPKPERIFASGFLEGFILEDTDGTFLTFYFGEVNDSAPADASVVALAADYAASRGFTVIDMLGDTVLSFKRPGEAA